MEELEKAKTRALTEFYFKDKYNIDTQDLEGKQINPNFEFGGIVVNVDKLITIEIRNKLSVGDKLEIMIPGVLKPKQFTIDKLYDVETNEEIDTINPGVKEQKVKIRFPFEVKEGYIVRRIK